MRDFRDAKAMAHTLRTALAAKGLKVTNSQSLELIAAAFGAADWNTLAAAIRDEPALGRKTTAGPLFSITENDQESVLSARFAATLHQAAKAANQRKHKYATLEHLLLALLDDTDAVTALKACNANIGVLRQKLGTYLDHGLKPLVTDAGEDTKSTAAFRRVIERASLHSQELGGDGATGANVLVAIFAETESPAARSLGEQKITRQDVVDFMTRDTGTPAP